MRVGLTGFFAATVACAASADGPSGGTYTLQFPSTAAAIATDTVQLLVFEAPSSAEERSAACSTLIQARKRKDGQKPLAENQPVGICELLFGRKPVNVEYGDRAIVAVAQRRGVDFLIGCTVQTVGQGDAVLPINLALVDVATAVPETTCSSIGDFCSVPQKCLSP